MKYWYLMCCLISATPSYAQTAMIPETAIAQGEKQAAVNPNPNSSELSNRTLLFSVLYGTLSGYLCRAFERNVLSDALAFRLLNLWLWGSVERSVIKEYIEDLEKQKITHSSVAVLNIARVVSWASYLLA